jgi:tRNA modification GTPase
MVDKVDTIAAIATPPGSGGIGIIRVTGPLTRKIARLITTLELTPRHAHFCTFQAGDKHAIDQGIAILFRGPASYTGEDMLELHGHGGRIVLQMVLQRLIELGARHARPGEFTERAFMNGKLDLLQAEAVADLISSMSTQAARGALQSLEGDFSRQIHSLYDRVVEICAHVESSLDFPDEEIDSHNIQVIRSRLQSCINDLNTMLIKSEQGRRLREGAYFVIAGKPNVGKSSLLNRLTNRESAIVSDVSGTTRDVISENILIKGIPVVLIDTAGLRDTDDTLEQEGVRRARCEIGKADIVLLVTETDEDIDETTQYVKDQLVEEANMIIIRNKIDLVGIEPHVVDDSTIPIQVYLSAKTGTGIDNLQKILSGMLSGDDAVEDIILARDRHLKALSRTKTCLEDGLEQLNDVGNPELLAEEVRRAQKVLDEITGATTTEELLGEIFSRFCIGK